MQINSLRYQVSKAGNLLFESPGKEGVHDDYLWGSLFFPQDVIQELNNLSAARRVHLLAGCRII